MDGTTDVAVTVAILLAAFLASRGRCWRTERVHRRRSPVRVRQEDATSSGSGSECRVLVKPACTSDVWQSSCHRHTAENETACHRKSTTDAIPDVTAVSTGQDPVAEAAATASRSDPRRDRRSLSRGLPAEVQEQAGPITLRNYGSSDKSQFCLTWLVCAYLILSPNLSYAGPVPASPPMPSPSSTAPLIAADQYLVFDEIGTMVTNLGFLHVLIPINITTLHDQAMLLAFNLHNLTIHANETAPTDTLRRVLIDILNVQIIKLDEVISDLITLDALLPETPTPSVPRKKRFIFLPPLIAVSVEYDHLKGRYADLSHQFNNLRSDYLNLQHKYNLLLQDRDFYKQKYQNLTMFVKSLQEKYPLDVEYPDTSSFEPVTAALSSYVSHRYSRRSHGILTTRPPRIFDENSDDLGLNDMRDTMTHINNIANLKYPPHVPPPPASDLQPEQPLIQESPALQGEENLEIGRAKRDVNIRIDNTTIQEEIRARIIDFVLESLKRIQNLSGDNLTNPDSPSFGPQPDPFYQNLPQGRERRAVGVGMVALGTLTGIGSALGTFLGMYNMAEIKNLANQVGNLNEQNKILMEISTKQDKAIKDLLSSIDNVNAALQGLIVHNPAVLQARLEHHINSFREKVRQSVHVLQQLQHRRLAVDYLDKQQLTLMHEALQAQAAQLGYEILPEKISDYFQLEASYVRTGPEVMLILHVPCVAPQGKLRMFRHVAYPFAINTPPRIRNNSIADALLLPGNDSLAFLPEPVPEALYLKTKDTLIAIGEQDRYKTFSESELTECDKHGRYFLCEGHQILRTQLAESCLGALYLRREEGVHAHCKFERRKLVEEVYQLSPNTFLIYSPIMFTTKQICTNQSITNSPIFIQGTTTVTVPPGCQVSLKSHVISADLNIRLSPPPVKATWKWNPLTFPSDMLEDVRAVDNRLSGVQEELARIRTESSITSETHQLQLLQLEQGRMLPWTGPIAYAAAFVAVIIVAAFAYGCYRQRQHARALATTHSVSVAYHPATESLYSPLPSYDQAHHTTATYNPSAPGQVETKKSSVKCGHNKLFGSCCPKPL